MKPTIIQETPITMFEVKKHLETAKKRDGELNFRATKTEEYLNQFVEISNTKGKELVKAVEALDIPRLKPEHVVKIIDVMPKTEEDMKVLMQGYVITITKDNIKKILGVING